MTSIRVLLVDGHDLFRRGLAEVLEDEPDIEVVAQAADGNRAVEAAARLLPDVVFMDLNMAGQSGIETTAYITQRWPDMKVLVLTVSEEISDLSRALSVGALGYVLKTASPQEIIDALRQVHHGWVMVSPAMAPRFLKELTQPEADSSRRRPPKGPGRGESHLTLREQEILQLVAQGLSNAEIAYSLVLSENTVKAHIKNILGKLQSKNRSEAVAYAAGMGFLKPTHGGEALLRP